MIQRYRPFRSGQRVRIAQFEGKVTHTNLRYITLESDDGEIRIPSSTADPVVVLKETKAMNAGTQTNRAQN